MAIIKAPIQNNKCSEAQFDYMCRMGADANLTTSDLLERASIIARRDLKTLLDLSKREASMVIDYLRELTGRNDKG